MTEVEDDDNDQQKNNMYMTTISNIKKYFLRALLIVAAFALTTACDNDEWSPYDDLIKPDASLNFSVLAASQTSVELYTSGNPSSKCALSIVAGGEWCSFSSTAKLLSISGRPNDTFTIYFSVNDSDSAREAQITVAFANGMRKQLQFTQLGVIDNSEYEHAWGEQPQYKEADAFVYKTYYTILESGKQVRNYSICYDTEKLVSQWVAYPVHDVYIKSTYSGRSDAWAFDDAVTQPKDGGGYTIISKFVPSLDTYDTYTLPIIPQQQQQNIIAGAYNDNPQNVRNLNRGHMLPSATRYNTWGTNAQTYYATNMMPQEGSFNSGSWASLEKYVRDSRCADTLFVVTGTIFGAGYKTLTTRGRNVAMPTQAYKLLLRTKKGNTGKSIAQITSADELICIGFLFNNDSSAANVKPSSAVVPVSEIESRTGFSFFRLLNPDIADQVKNQHDIGDWPAIK